MILVKRASLGVLNYTALQQISILSSAVGLGFVNGTSQLSQAAVTASV